MTMLVVAWALGDTVETKTKQEALYALEPIPEPDDYTLWQIEVAEDFETGKYDDYQEDEICPWMQDQSEVTQELQRDAMKWTQ